MKTDLPYKKIDIPELDKVIAELREAWAEMLIQNPTDGTSPSADSQPGSISLQA